MLSPQDLDPIAVSVERSESSGAESVSPQCSRAAAKAASVNPETTFAEYLIVLNPVLIISRREMIKITSVFF